MYIKKIHEVCSHDRSLLHLHQVQIVLGQVSKTNDQIIAETKKKKPESISHPFFQQ